MFEEFSGIPAHPLLVHAAVIFVPLQILAAVLYVVVPFTRRYLWWAVLGLGVVGPLTAWTAKLSGDAFFNRLLSYDPPRVSPEFVPRIEEHSSFGDMTAYFATALGVVMLVLVLVLIKPPRATGDVKPAAPSMLVTVASAVVVLALAGATGYYVFKVGDSGAHMVWESYYS